MLATICQCKVHVTKNGVFVGKGYSINGMSKLSINEINATAHPSDSSIWWHARLGHINYGYLRYMSKNNYINCKNNNERKCEVCVEAKNDYKTFSND